MYVLSLSDFVFYWKVIVGGVKLVMRCCYASELSKKNQTKIWSIVVCQRCVERMWKCRVYWEHGVTYAHIKLCYLGVVSMYKEQSGYFYMYIEFNSVS